MARPAHEAGLIRVNTPRPLGCAASASLGRTKKSIFTNKEVSHMTITMNELIERAQRELDACEDETRRCLDTVSSIRDKAERGETVQDHRVKAEVRNLDKARRAEGYARDKLHDLKSELAEDRRVAELREQIVPTGVRSARSTGTFRVNDRAVYTRDGAERGERSFLTDLFRSQVLRDPQASQRLAEHGDTQPERQTRDIGTANVAGFTPPAYLSELFAEYARAGRPVANLATPMPLPAVGMQVVVPRITTPTSVGVQTAENAAVTESDPDDTLLQVPVNTIAGFVDISRQSIERGELVEQVVLADLASAYNAALDAQVLNGTGLNGQHLGIRATSGVNTVTYTDASPTLPELYPQLAKAAGLIVSGRFAGPSHFVMHPTTWAWVVSRLDADNRPLVLPDGQGPANSLGTAEAPTYGGFAGNLLGVPVVLDANVGLTYGGGTETEIYVVAAADMMLWEDPSLAPAQLRFDEPGSANLTVRLLAYGYSAFTAGRQPKAVSVVSGTGLAALTP